MMNILAIESSCDETSAAVIQDGTTILSNVVASSAQMHTQTGGIIPEIAARQQISSIIPVIDKALSQAFPKEIHSSSRKDIFIHYPLLSNIQAIAVTIGPGLIGSLLVGVETAKTLSMLTSIPIIGVNHLVGHLYANWLTDHSKNPTPSFPALGLVVSGGHTDLVLMTDHGQIEHIGSTRDDAAGEAFDKTARLIGLPYPGGPAIAKAADHYFESSSAAPKLDLFPRPLSDTSTFEFSFSGLKTAVLRLTQSEEKNARHTTFRLAAEIQEAIVDVLVSKSLRAIQHFRPKSFLLAGGVAANVRLRKSLQDEIQSKDIAVAFHVPKPELCTDNAAYIGSAAYFNQKITPWREIDASPQLTITD